MRMVSHLAASTSSAGARSRAALGQVRAGGATLDLWAYGTYLRLTEVGAGCVAGHPHPAHAPLRCAGPATCSSRQQQCHLCQPYGAAAEVILKRRIGGSRATVGRGRVPFAR
jgi:hypothetical protein